MEKRDTFAVVGNPGNGTVWSAGHETIESATTKADEIGLGACVVKATVKWDASKVLYQHDPGKSTA